MIRIKPSERNTNKHTEQGMELLQKSIEKVGVIESISDADDGTLISGHARKEVFVKKGMRAKEIELDDDEFAVLKTKIKANSKEYYEAQILANTTGHKNYNLDIEEIEIIAEEYGIDIEEIGVEVLESEEQVLEAVEDDFDQPLPEHPITVLGDLYEIGEHRLLCGDSTDSDQVAKLMDGKKAELIVTDPPYNVNYNNSPHARERKKENGFIENDNMDDSSFLDFLNSVFLNYRINARQGCVFYIFYSSSQTVPFYQSVENNLATIRQQLIWVKNTIVLSFLDYHYKHEPIIYGWMDSDQAIETGSQQGKIHYFTDSRNKATVFEDDINVKKLSKQQLQKIVTEIYREKIPNTIIRADKPSKNIEHPTMKPILLIAELIQNSSTVNNLVIDFFLGSGSTMVASHQLKRKCYGMELDCRYADVIVKRMLNLDSSLTVKRNGVDCKAEFLA